ncbi:MAG: tetratricopeptide repeat protein [Pseudolabrys sp.]|nr:tetratricopeptide repeat protein [Pseudolabrys sp.]
MSDIFHEVDEEVRRERLKSLWERYSLLIIAFAVLFVGSIAAWRGYEYWVSQRAAAAGAQFEAAAVLSEAGKHAEAEAAFAKVASDAPQGYRALARLRIAAAQAAATPADAVKTYDDIAGDGRLGVLWQDLAAVRAGFLLVDTAPLADMTSRLTPLTEPGRPYRHSARELLALSAWRHQDAAAARKYVDMISADNETPPGTRARIDVLSALIAAGAGKS